MKDEQKDGKVAQGANTVPKETKLPSPTVCLRTMAETIKRMEKIKMLEPEEYKTLATIQNKLVTRWIGGNLGL